MFEGASPDVSPASSRNCVTVVGTQIKKYLNHPHGRDCSSAVLRSLAHTAQTGRVWLSPNRACPSSSCLFPCGSSSRTRLGYPASLVCVLLGAAALPIHSLARTRACGCWEDEEGWRGQPFVAVCAALPQPPVCSPAPFLSRGCILHSHSELVARSLSRARVPPHLCVD